MISCFQLNLVSNDFQTCLKGFKLKKISYWPKTAQPVEPDEESVNPQLNRSRGAKNSSLSSRMIVQPIKVEPQPVDPHLNRSRSGQGAVEVQRSLTKH